MDTDEHGLENKGRHEFHECSRIQDFSFVPIGEIRVSHPCSSVSIRGFKLRSQFQQADLAEVILKLGLEMLAVVRNIQVGAEGREVVVSAG